MLCLQFPLAGWPGHELLWGSLLCRLPGTARWNALLPCRVELLFAVAAAAGAPCGMPLTEVAAREGRAIQFTTKYL